MLIPSEYLLEEGKEIPEGSVIKKCRFCNNTYTVPNDIASKVIDVCDKDICKDLLDKEIGEAVHALMNPNKIESASDIINRALGK